MWHDILMVVIGLIVGGVLGFFLSRMFMEKYLEHQTKSKLIK